MNVPLLMLLLPFINAVVDLFVNACTPTAGGSDEFTLGGRNPPPLNGGEGAANNGTETTSGMPCTQCQTLLLPVRREVINSKPITQTVDAGGGVNSRRQCTTLALECTGNAADSAVILTYYNTTSDDVGSTFGSAQVTAVLACAADGQWAVGNATNVAELECISS